LSYKHGLKFIKVVENAQISKRSGINIAFG